MDSIDFRDKDHQSTLLILFFIVKSLLIDMEIDMNIYGTKEIQTSVRYNNTVALQCNRHYKSITWNHLMISF